MKTDKEQMIEEIRFYSQAMRTNFVQVKLTQTHLDHYVLNMANGLPFDLVEEAYVWIKGIFDAEYATILKIKKLLSEEMWERYRVWGGFEDHRESVMLREAHEAFRAKLVSKLRPAYFHRKVFDAYAKDYAAKSALSLRAQSEGKARKRSSGTSKNGGGTK